MGRKQRVKKERGGTNKSSLRPSSAPGSRWTAWLVGVIVFVSLMIAGMVFFIQANKARFIKLSVLTTAQNLQQNLNRVQANFTRSESSRIRGILQTIENIAGAKKDLDIKTGGHLMFVLKVAEEIMRDGKLQPGEIDKMEMLLRQVNHQFQRREKK